MKGNSKKKGGGHGLQINNFGNLQAQPINIHRNLHHYDVLMGRGRSNANHTGNIFFAALIQKYANKYFFTYSDDIKRGIIENIAGEIKLRGGKFLRRGHDSWCEVTDDQTRQKVAHAMQYKIRRTFKRMNVDVPQLREKVSDSQYETYVMVNDVSNALHNDMLLIDSGSTFSSFPTLKYMNISKDDGAASIQTNSTGNNQSLLFNPCASVEKVVDSGSTLTSAMMQSPSLSVKCVSDSKTNTKSKTMKVCDTVDIYMPKISDPTYAIQSFIRETTTTQGQILQRPDTPQTCTLDVSGAFSIKSLGISEEEMQELIRLESLDKLMTSTIPKSIF